MHSTLGHSRPFDHAHLHAIGTRLNVVLSQASHPAEFEALRKALGRDSRVVAEHGDGHARLLALLPPVTRRGLVLIDPPYEDSRADWRAAAATTALPAFAQEKTLTVYTYESFVSDWGPGPKVKEEFEKTCGCTVEWVGVADGVKVSVGVRVGVSVAVGLGVSVGASANGTTFRSPPKVTNGDSTSQPCSPESSLIRYQIASSLMPSISIGVLASIWPITGYCEPGPRRTLS